MDDIDEVSEAGGTSDEDRLESAAILTAEGLIHYEKDLNLVDVALGSGKAVWTVSSAKHGSGVIHLLDSNDLNTYWQSDGVLPHVVTIQLSRLTSVNAVAIYLDHTRDESYTPKSIKVRAGTHPGDLADLAQAEVENDPSGWLLLFLEGDNGSEGRPGGIGEAAADRFMWCTTIEVHFLENFQRGRDCHVRAVRVLGPPPRDGGMGLAQPPLR